MVTTMMEVSITPAMPPLPRQFSVLPHLGESGIAELWSHIKKSLLEQMKISKLLC
jgi:hypothetical protein